jgi:hypothetical protein
VGNGSGGDTSNIAALPDLCAEAHLEIDEMTYVDRLNFAAEWLKQVG